MRVLILSRHGESEYSAKQLGNGDPAVPVPLTEKGQEEARALARKLAGDAIELCVTTEFLRTKQTADLALEGRAISRTIDGRLNDIKYGMFEGKPLDEYNTWAGGNPPAASPAGGGESYVAFLSRVCAGLEAVTQRPEDLLLAVTHDKVIQALQAALANRLPPEHGDNIPSATPFRFSRDECAAALKAMRAWLTERNSSPH